jgi:hypothetical protein
MAAAVRDLTELRRAQQQTLRAQRLESIGTLAGGVAHDLNNALAPIVVATELLHERYPDSTELIDTMSSSARRAEHGETTSHVRPGVGGARLLIQPLHLLLKWKRSQTFPQEHRSPQHYAPRLHTVLGDTTQLHQVLLNLCQCLGGDDDRGAAHHGRTRAEGANANAFPEARPGQYAVWRVTDTGTGIPPEISERIFEPFFSTKGLTKGTGLGLSTATGIVNSHGGFIKVSSPRGQGATFEVYLPASDTINAVTCPPCNQSGDRNRALRITQVLTGSPRLTHASLKCACLMDLAEDRHPRPWADSSSRDGNQPRSEPSFGLNCRANHPGGVGDARLDVPARNQGRAGVPRLAPVIRDGHQRKKKPSE